MSYRVILRTGARVLGLLAFLIVVAALFWAAAALGDEWISDFGVPNDMTQTQPGTTEVVSPSAPTVEPEDFIPWAFSAVLAGSAVLGFVAAWRSRPWLVLLAALLVLGLAIISLWSIGLFVAPASLLLVLAALALFLAGARQMEGPGQPRHDRG